MPLLTRTITVPYTAEQMYALVNNIAAYPDFLPWCEATQVHTLSHNQIEATVHLKWMGIKQSFSTCNTQTEPERITMQLIRGPFRTLSGTWAFVEESSSSTITLTLDFEFSNTLIAMSFGPIFAQIAQSLIDSFQARAKVLYSS